ncbi:MAG: hypothetical protein H7A51_19295 [Akkermansiaceae bacterium]|nr:hypothetical protein [Akkermansiaceae bacterium]
MTTPPEYLAAALSNGTPPDYLEFLNRPMHEALGGFIHDCSPDPTTRTVAATALTMSLWQLQGTALTPHVPSLLLIRPRGAGPDPIDESIRPLVYDDDDDTGAHAAPEKDKYTQGYMATRSMPFYLRQRRALGRLSPNADSLTQSEAKLCEKHYWRAQATLHGNGLSRCYRRAWHPDHGLLTSRSHLILRLNDDADRSDFCGDFLASSPRLLQPVGYGPDLFPAQKKVSFSGALSTALWTKKLAGMMLATAKPIIVLPHTTDDPLDGKHLKLLKCFAFTWRAEHPLPIHASLQLPSDPWIRGYHNALRKRLAVMPVEVEFAMLHTIHSLWKVCGTIVTSACRRNVASDESVALCNDLYRHTLRGVVIGMAGYSWHGLGLPLDPVCEPLRVKASRILGKLRSAGPLSKTDLLKNFHLKKLERDMLLHRLTESHLVRVDGRQVVATTHREFVECLYADAEFPPVQNQWGKAV